MSLSSSPPTRGRAAAAVAERFLPAVVLPIALFVAATQGIRSPITWVVAIPLFVVGFVIAMQHLRILVLWAVPVSMCWFVYMPVLHYEALVLLIAGFMGLAAVSRFRLADFRLQPLEWRYAIFLLAMLPGVAGATSLWRFGGAFKIYLVGLLAFEITRHAVRHYGREALLWGPALFCAITSFMLFIRVAASGVPAFKSVELRVYLSDLTWGTSNYVAAVLVLCLPSLVHLTRLTGRGTWKHTVALALLVCSLTGLLITTSRGGFALAAVYLLSFAAALRKRLWLLLVIIGMLAAVLAMTPYGQGLFARFTGARNLDSMIFRLFIWQAALMRGLRHLPFGVGAGQGLIQNDKLQVIDPHNFLLTLFSELGPIAMAAWLWLFATLWRMASRLQAREETQVAGEAMRGTLAIVSINFLFEPTMGGNLYHLLFWWLMGIHSGLGGLAGRPSAPPRSDR